jgi:predicted Zn-dependent protease
MMSEFDDSLNTPEGAEVAKAYKQELMSPDSRGLTLAHVVGFSEEEVKATYAKACQKLAQNDLVSAGKLFVTLVALRHNEAKYWRGLGIVSQRAGQFGPCDFLYSMALKNDPSDLISMVFRAEARINTGRAAAGRQDLLSAIEIGDKIANAEQVPYVKRAKKVLQLLDAGDVSGSFEK